MKSLEPLLCLEMILTGFGIATAVAGYLLEVPSLEFFGIVLACVAFGLLIARAFGAPSSRA